jgi:hypothetical protein
MDTAETPTARYTLRSDGIILQRIKSGARQELKDAQENMEAFLRLAAGQKRLLLVDLRESGPSGRGVREYYAENSTRLLASAFLVGSSLSQMIGNFFINVNRPASPCRLFTSEQAALLWLKTHPQPRASSSASS